MKKVFNKLFVLMFFILFFISSSYSTIDTSDNNARAYYNFSNAGLDATGRFATITATGSPAVSTGIIGNAYRYNGAQNYDVASLPVSAFPFTFNAWIKTNSSTGSQGFVAIGESTGNNDYFGLFTENGNITLEARNGISGFTSITGTQASNDTWFMVTGVFNSATDRRLYINGINIGNDTVSTVIDASVNQFAIGQNADNQIDQFFTGVVDEVGVFNVSLTSAEVEQLYASGVGCTWDFSSCQASPTATITTNLTNNNYYPNANISVESNTSNINTNMSVSINGGSFTDYALNLNYSVNTINFTEGQNNVSFKANTSGTIAYTNLTIYIDTINPSLNVTNNSEFSSYTINFSQIVSCSDLNLQVCNISIDNGDIINTSNQSYTFTYNGNHTFNVTAYDLAGNTNTSIGNVLLINPEFKVYFNNNTEYVTNFLVNGTNYTNYFNGSIYDYGLGNHSFNFSKTGYSDFNFTLTFTNTSNINQTIYISPVFITILIRNVDNGSLASPNNYTILLNNLDQTISSIYNVVNNNTLIIANSYAQDTNISVSLVTNDSIVNTLYIVNPRTNYTITLYLTEQNEEQRVFEVLDSSLNVVPNSYVFLYTYIPTNNTFVLQSQKTTNELGLVSFDIVPLTKIYNVCNTYEGQEVCLNQVTFENVNTDPNQIIHATDLSAIEVKFLNYLTWSYNDNKTNENISQMTFTFTDSQSLVSRFCLNVSRFTNGTPAYVGEYCNNNPSGQIVQSFNLGNDQYIDYTFFYTYEGNNSVLFNYQSYYFNPSFDDLKDNGILDLAFLLIVFGGIGFLLGLKNFEFYNAGFLIGLLVIFIIQSVINSSYVNLGVWGILFIKTATYYAVRVEGQ